MKVINRYERLKTLIYGKARCKYDKSCTEKLAADIGVCYSTLLNKLAKPENITLGELFKFCKALDLTKNDIDYVFETILPEVKA